MKPNTLIEPGLLANEAEFTDDFFQQFDLRHAKQPLKLTDTISKDYQFPTLYGNVTCAIGIFLCDYKKAQAMLPHPKMKPVAMPKGRALVTFSCYEYQSVRGVAPYNEIAMTIPVMIDPSINVPILPVIMDGLFKKFGYYVFHMPVTSLENRIRGRDIWGLPKVVDTINIKVAQNISKTSAIDELGNEYFSLFVPTTGKASHFDVKSNIYSKLENQLLQSPTQFKAQFNVNKYMNRLWQKGGKDPGLLTLGKGPYGDLLRTLDIEPQPFQFRYAAHMNACFDLPNKDYQAPFSFTG
jgi:hypothetical protein